MKNPTAQKITFAVQALESRTLLSATPIVPPPSNPVIDADRKAIQADYTQIKADAQAFAPKIQADLAALAKARSGLSSQVAPLQTTLKADLKAASDLAKTVGTAVAGVYKQDGPALETALKQLFKDTRSGAPAATLTADKAAVDAAKATLKADLDAVQTQFKAQLDAAQQKIKDDQAAIQAVYAGDTTVKAAQDQLTADQQALEAALKADYKQLQADLLKLAQDLKGGTVTPVTPAKA